VINLLWRTPTPERGSFFINKVTNAMVTMRRDPKERAEYTRRRRDKRKDKLIEMFGDKCNDCGGTFHKCAYDFHHVNPLEKKFEIAPSLDRNWETILEEVGKCVMLCSNCHRVRHYREDRGDTHFDSFLV
jgi:predicted HNH restriction endonuclease